ncbi:uncharacterized protein LOC103501151 isoform X1 [Cucumis melo]|uniref:Uncharacterized protein LOC103501151 isoform X1 n=1 Tax=Cucumis melo TaxID=3656 RepID=A0A1S3CJH3_CUCME|nr:uncharacterized protein LOC103501151 isoform X1 [Cucumis melo]
MANHASVNHHSERFCMVDDLERPSSMLPATFVGVGALHSKDKANPLATVLSAAMLLKYGLGEENAATRIEAVVLDTLGRGFRIDDIYLAGCVYVKYFDITLIPSAIFFFNAHHMKMDSGFDAQMDFR